MKNSSVLALALAVLPAAVSGVAVQNHCYVKYTCLKDNIGPIAADAASTAAQKANYSGASSGTASVGQCKAGVTTADTAYINATGQFDGKAGTTDTTADCLSVLKGTDAAMGTDVADPKVQVARLLKEYYKNSACTKKLSTDTSTITNKVTWGAITSAGIIADSDELTVAETKTKAADKIIALTTKNVPEDLEDFPDIGLGAEADFFAKVPTISGHDYTGTNNDKSGTETDSSPGSSQSICMTAATAFAAAVNLPNTIAGASGTSSKEAQYAPYVFGGGALNKAEYTAATATALDYFASGITAHCAKDDGALTIKYHSTSGKCKGNAPTWTPNGAQTQDCFPVLHMRSADCEGARTCTTAVVETLKHIAAESKADKACGTSAGNKTDGTAKNKACSKECQCPKTYGKELNYAVSKTGDCFRGATQEGQLLLETSIAPAAATKAAFLAGNIAAATGANSPTAVAFQAVFTQVNALITDPTGETSSGYKCNWLEKTAAGDSATEAQKKFTTAGADAMWTAKGCGYEGKGGSGGATAKFVSAGLATVVMTVAAALM